MEQIDKIAAPGDDEFVFVAVQLFNKLPDAVIVVDDTGAIKYLNDETERLTGYHRSELHGKTVESLVPDELKTMHKDHREKYINDPRLRAMGTGLTLHIRRKNGVLVPVEINLAPLPTPWGMRTIAAIRRKPA